MANGIKKRIKEQTNLDSGYNNNQKEAIDCF